MTGREFVGALEKHGFTVRRRSRSFVWLLRGDQSLMVDEEANVPDAFLERLLGPSARPSRAPRSSRRPSLSRSLGSIGSPARAVPKA
ncbi:MAG: hypothetical protein JWP97_3909 [Labilithrix sp.]|nr:hypothetical protein [Labilithrix sp.]